MKPITISYKDSQLNEQDLRSITPRLQEEIERMKAASKLQYEDERASIHAPFDSKAVNLVKQLAQEKKKLKPQTFFLIGIGGSNLGALAVLDAVLGRYDNYTTKAMKLFYADTVDSDLMAPLLSIAEHTLKNKQRIILNGISKSGHTTETIANFEVLEHLLQQYQPHYEKSVIITTQKDSDLYALALKKHFDVLEIPRKVGGRFSVFSPVGLFPLAMMGIDIDGLLRGAQEMRDRCLTTNVLENPAALSAALIYLQKQKGKTIHDLFLFNPDLEAVGRWYRQLMGECLGKQFNRQNAEVFEGITPTVSIGSTDLHSMAQLYLGGPFDKFTTFVHVEKNHADVRLPTYEEYNTLVKGIQGRPLDEIMHAIFLGTKAAFRNQKRPFIELTLPDKTASSIGQLLQMKMMEMMYLGFMLGINPFDQPNVEAYKKETRQILEHTK